MSTKKHRNLDHATDGIHPPWATATAIKTDANNGETLEPGTHYICAGPALGGSASVSLNLPDGATHPTLKIGDIISATISHDASGGDSTFTRINAQGTDVLVGGAGGGIASRTYDGQSDFVIFYYGGDPGIGARIWHCVEFDRDQGISDRIHMFDAATTAAIASTFAASGTSGDADETITFNANGQQTIGGVSFTPGDRLFIKDEAGVDRSFHGGWICEVQGDGSTQAVFRRTGDWNSQAFPRFRVALVTRGTLKGNLYAFGPATPGDQSDVYQVAPSSGIQASLFDANTILKADADDTPVALPLTAGTLVGFASSGSAIAALVRHKIDHILYNAGRVNDSTTGTENGWAPGGGAQQSTEAWLIRWTGGTLLTVRGLRYNGTDDLTVGKWIYNDGSADIVLQHEDVNATLANYRIRTPDGQPYRIRPGDMVRVILNEQLGSPRWIVADKIRVPEWGGGIAGTGGPFELTPGEHINGFNDSAGDGITLHLPVATYDGEEVTIKEQTGSANVIIVTTAAGTVNIQRPDTGAMVTTFTLGLANACITWKWDVGIGGWRIIRKAFI